MTPDKIRKWNQLNTFATKIPNYQVGIGLLINVNCVKALQPLPFILSINRGSYFYETALGWCAVGPIETSKSGKTSLQCSLMSVQQEPNYEYFFGAQVKFKDAGIGTMLLKLYELEFKEENSVIIPKVSEKVEELSAEAKKFLKLKDAESKR